jgi:cytosine/adenosine deaminase-related metal-dependent hydrolase
MAATEPTSTLIRGADCVWTGAARLDAAAGNDIRICGARIEAIGRLTALPGETVVDARDKVVMPGWVNTHHHLFQSLLKGVPAGINQPLAGWLSAVPVHYRRGFDAEDIFRLAVRVGLVELLLSGCSTVADHQYHYYPGMPFDASAIAFDEAGRLGMRMVLARGGQTQNRAIDPNPCPQTAPETLDAFLQGVSDDAARFHDPSPLSMRRVVCAPTTPTWSVPVDQLKTIARHARALGLGLHSHLSETADYVHYCREVYHCTPVEFAQDHEWLGPDVWFAHMVHVSPAEIALLASTQTGIAHCPQSNGRLGSGVAPIADMLKAGVRVSLAVDGAASNEAADMLSEAHACWLLQRSAHGAGSLRVDDVVALGTRGGAQVLGLEDVGTLAVGMAADLVVYDLDQPCHVGIHDTGSAPVISGRAKVDALYIQGQLRVQGGVVPGLDMPSLRAQARAAVAVLRSLG